MLVSLLIFCNSIVVLIKHQAQNIDNDCDLDALAL